MQIRNIILMSMLALSACSSNSQEKKKEENAGTEDTLTSSVAQNVELPSPYATKSVQNFVDVTGWPEGKMPTAPQGFHVMKFASELRNPRWIYVANNGDIFVAEATTDPKPVAAIKNKVSGKSKSQNLGNSANRITLFRDTNHDGMPDMQTVFLDGLNQNFGMLIANNKFYVANTDAVYVFPYQYGQTKMTARGTKIISLPAGGYNNHWTRNLLTNSDSSKLYVTVGSGSNVGEHGMDNEIRRANVLQFDMNGKNEMIYASGLRNPVGLDWAPGSKVLWAAVNERDELGDELVPDYITSVKEGGFYGWPYSYWGQHEDPRLKDKQRPDLVKKAIVPDVDMGAHTASLGLAFDQKKSLPGKYAGGAFVGQHGSWNRSQLSGYMVAFVPFSNGKASGKPEPFLTGFIEDEANSKVYGRPVGVAFTKDGYMLVADDAANTIWCVMKN